MKFLQLVIAEKPIKHLVMQQEAEFDLIMSRFYLTQLKANATNNFRKWLRKTDLKYQQQITDSKKDILKSYSESLLLQREMSGFYETVTKKLNLLNQNQLSSVD